MPDPVRLRDDCRFATHAVSLEERRDEVVREFALYQTDTGSFVIQLHTEWDGAEVWTHFGLSRDGLSLLRQLLEEGENKLRKLDRPVEVRVGVDDA